MHLQINYDYTDAGMAGEGKTQIQQIQAENKESDVMKALLEYIRMKKN